MNANEEKKVGLETQTLAVLLGQLDAVFAPFVGNGERRSLGAVMELRKGWLSGQGLPCRATGDATERKAAELLWKRLEDSGLVTVARAHGRRTHARLTTGGETLIRSLAGTGTIWSNWPFFRRLVKVFDSMDRNSLPESFTANCEPWCASDEQSRLVAAQRLRLMPFVTGGYLSLWHDCRGCLWISLTTAGRAAIGAGRPPRPPGEWGFNGAVADLYDSAFRRETKRLRTLTPTNPHAFWPPFSAGLGWGDFRKHLVLERELAEKRIQWERDADAARAKHIAEFEGRALERLEVDA